MAAISPAVLPVSVGYQTSTARSGSCSVVTPTSYGPGPRKAASSGPPSTVGTAGLGGAGAAVAAVDSSASLESDESEEQAAAPSRQTARAAGGCRGGSCPMGPDSVVHGTQCAPRHRPACGHCPGSDYTTGDVTALPAPRTGRRPGAVTAPALVATLLAALSVLAGAGGDPAPDAGAQGGDRKVTVAGDSISVGLGSQLRYVVPDGTTVKVIGEVERAWPGPTGSTGRPGCGRWPRSSRRRSWCSPSAPTTTRP